MEAIAGSLAPATAAVAVGYVLRSSGVFTALDGQTAAKYVTWLTLPSLILQSFNKVPLQPAVVLPAVGVAALVGAAAAAAGWLLLGGRAHPKERGLLSGCAVGGGLALTAFPLVEAVLGREALRLALLWGAANNVAVWVGMFLLFSTAGAAFPEQYEHVDGGRYRGEWKGMLKDGFGIYTYPSGARYEGEWIENLKEGRGVYHFPKGGVYEGEWRAGKMEGLGVRTFASGKVQAGVWSDGRLQTPMEERQCALAVEGANEAAAAARRVQVGSGSLQRAVAHLLADPSTWAYAAVALLAVVRRPLTPTLDVFTQQLATAHAPLALLALGLSLDLQLPQARQMREVTGVLAARLLPPLLLAAAATAILGGPLQWPASKVVGLVAPLLLCGLAPVAPQAQEFAYRFRLNENLAAALSRASTLYAAVFMPLVAAAAALTACTGTLRPFQAVVGAATASVVLAVAAGRQQRPSGPPQRPPPGKVRMVYAGPAGGSSLATGEAAATEEQQQHVPAPSPSSSAFKTAGDEEESLAIAAEPAQQGEQEQGRLRQGSAFQDVDDTASEGGPAGSDGGGGGSSGVSASSTQAARLPLPRRALLPRLRQLYWVPRILPARPGGPQRRPSLHAAAFRLVPC